MASAKPKLANKRNRNDGSTTGTAGNTKADYRAAGGRNCFAEGGDSKVERAAGTGWNFRRIRRFRRCRNFRSFRVVRIFRIFRIIRDYLRSNHCCFSSHCWGVMPTSFLKARAKLERSVNWQWRAIVSCDQLGCWRINCFAYSMRSWLIQRRK